MGALLYYWGWGTLLILYHNVDISKSMALMVNNLYCCCSTPDVVYSNPVFDDSMPLYSDSYHQH